LCVLQVYKYVYKGATGLTLSYWLEVNGQRTSATYQVGGAPAGAAAVPSTNGPPAPAGATAVFDEIETFVSGRSICSHEAVWRLLGFDVQVQRPNTVTLSLHSPGQQLVHLPDDQVDEEVEAAVLSDNGTSLTAYFRLNEEFSELVSARGAEAAIEHYDGVDVSRLLYQDVPQFFTLHQDKTARTACWRRRMRGDERVKGRVRRQNPIEPGEAEGEYQRRLACLREWTSSDTVARIRMVAPSNSEEFALRLLLVTVPGPTSFEALRTVRGLLCATFKEACIERGLCDDEREYRLCMEEAASEKMPAQLRALFVSILVHCGHSNPSGLYAEFEDLMGEDFIEEERRGHAARRPRVPRDVPPVVEDREIAEDMAWRRALVRRRARQQRVAAATAGSRASGSGGHDPADSDYESLEDGDFEADESGDEGDDGGSLSSFLDDRPLSPESGTGATGGATAAHVGPAVEADPGADANADAGADDNSEGGEDGAGPGTADACVARGRIRLRLEIQTLLRAHGSQLEAFNLRVPTDAELDSLVHKPLRHTNPLIEYELSAAAELPRRTRLWETANHAYFRRFTPEQRGVYDTIRSAVARKKGGVFFLNAPGGTGKSFVLSTLLADLRSRGHVAVACATSGIAATIYELGHTVHSAFRLPTDESLLASMGTLFGPNTRQAGLMTMARLVIIDEAVMLRKDYLELIDRTMRDIEADGDSPFGGRCVFVLAGDFRQVLPVIRGGDRDSQVRACLKNWSLWLRGEVQELTLTRNMRAATASSATDAQNIQKFSDFVLGVGDGKLSAEEIRVALGRDYIQLPDDVCVARGASVDTLLGIVFPDLERNYSNQEWLMKRALLCSRNDEVDKINEKMSALITWDEGVCLPSHDSVAADDDPSWYTAEFLNSLSPSGVPPHNLTLKRGMPVMLLRNLNPLDGDCNGTRYVVRNIGARYLELETVDRLSGRPRVFFCPRITLHYSEVGVFLCCLRISLCHWICVSLMHA